MSEFWIYQGSEYAKIRQGSEYTMNTVNNDDNIQLSLNNSWISLVINVFLSSE